MWKWRLATEALVLSKPRSSPPSVRSVSTVQLPTTVKADPPPNTSLETPPIESPAAAVPNDSEPSAAVPNESPAAAPSELPLAEPSEPPAAEPNETNETNETNESPADVPYESPVMVTMEPPAVVEEPEPQPATYPALEDEAIVFEICRWLGPPDLASVMQVAQFFKPIAEKALWGTYAQVENLLLALPSSTLDRSNADNLVFSKPAKPSDWAEPRRLAAMIQKLDQPRLARLTDQTLLELISYGPNISLSTTFCPQITTLIWSASQPAQIYAARMFTAPSLKLLRLNLEGPMASDSDALDLFLEHVGLTSQSLETLEIFSPAPTTPKSILDQRLYDDVSGPGSTNITLNPSTLACCFNLHSINLHISLNVVPLLKSLSSLPHLHTIRAHVSASPDDVSHSEQITFNALHTLSLTGGALAIVDLLNKVHAPGLVTLDLDVDDVYADWHNHVLNQLCRGVAERVKNIAKTRLSFTDPSSSLNFTSPLEFCAIMAHDVVIRCNTLSLTTISSSPSFLTTQRLSLLATSGWEQALPLPKLLDLLHYFPALRHLDIGLDASDFHGSSRAPEPYDSALETLSIYPGPIDSSWPVAFFLGSILPSTQISVKPVGGRAITWDEVVRAIPELQRSVLVERRSRELEQEVSRLREKECVVDKRTQELEQEVTQLREKIERQESLGSLSSPLPRHSKELELEVSRLREKEGVVDKRTQELELEVTRLRARIERQESSLGPLESPLPDSDKETL